MIRRALPCLIILAAGCMEAQKPTPLQRSAAPKPTVAEAPPPTTPTPTRALYDRLGGKDKIVKIVDSLFNEVLDDNRIRAEHKKHFKDGDIGLKKKLVDQIGQATGGPEKYTGKTMKDSHRNLKITNEEFDALVDDLVEAMRKNAVPVKEQNELKALLAPMRGDIVEK